MRHCVSCGVVILPEKGVISNVCKHCSKPKEIGFPSIKTTMTVGDGYKTSKAQLDELERRVILPDHDPSGGYFVGRRGENGKIQEREPDYA